LSSTSPSPLRCFLLSSSFHLFSLLGLCLPPPPPPLLLYFFPIHLTRLLMPSILPLFPSLSPSLLFSLRPSLSHSLSPPLQRSRSFSLCSYLQPVCVDSLQQEDHLSLLQVQLRLAVAAKVKYRLGHTHTHTHTDKKHTYKEETTHTRQ
ncbi:hypothetical protein PFLUV_G00003700, partial [Perca fluviatilis]